MSRQYQEMLGGGTGEKDRARPKKKEEEKRGYAYPSPSAAQIPGGEDSGYVPFGDSAAAKPQYKSKYARRLDSLYDGITNRDPFSYSAESDPLYLQYRDKYTLDGELAMRDSMGYAGGLTGGYGSSYSQAVGQQKYGEYMRELNDVMPELYKQAYEEYKDEGDWLMQQYGLLSDREGADYSRYRDDMSDWESERNFELKLQELEYDRLLYMMQNSRYMPGEKQLKAAGISKKQAEELYKSLHG